MAAAALDLQDVLTGTGGTTTGAGAGGFDGVSIDTRTLRPGQLFFAIRGPNFDGHDFVAEAARKGAAAAVVHREVPEPGVRLVRVKDTTAALADLARHVRGRQKDLRVVAVTGSAGKTTTKEMTAALLGVRGPVLKTEGNLNNQYGLPLMLLRLGAEHVAAVLELGMSAAGELRELSAIAQPDVAVITMVAPVHLEFFKDVDGIADAKAEILEGLKPGGVAVLNHDDERVRVRGERHRAAGGRVLWFGRDRACDVSAENVRGTVHGMRFDLRFGGRTHDVALPLPGPHFVQNFLAAAAAAHHLGVTGEEIVAAASTLQAAKRRGEVLRLAGGVTVLDDSYNSNPTAVEAAVAALDMSAKGRRVAFIGDMLELGPQGPALHRETGRKAASRLQLLVGVGPLSRHTVEGAAEAGVETVHFASSEEAAAAAPGLVKPGDAVLVKGSRGVRMERIVEALASHLGERGA
jgi:UDP-N-acetylmuramoyl-tripeptide--D-alanyl-D-alanine ligase